MCLFNFFFIIKVFKWLSNVVFVLGMFLMRNGWGEEWLGGWG